MANLPLIIAHRGLHRDEPENSIPAFEAALAAGFNWVECDVHGLADGVPVIVHDATLERMTDAAGRVGAMSQQELTRVKLKDGNGVLTSVGLPTLQEAADAMAGRACMLVEIKPPNAATLVAAVMRVFERWPGRLMIQSFDPANVMKAWGLDSKMPGAILIEKEESLLVALRESWPTIHVDHRLLTPAVMKMFIRKGTNVGVWTVNEVEDIRRVLALGVDTIITDEPERVREMCLK